MGTVGIEVVGYENVMSALAALGQQTLTAAGEAIQAESEYELTLTQAEVPVLTGALQGSGRVEPADDATTVANIIAYGGPAGSGPNQAVDVDYALIVHENLEAHHPHGKAKYVEDVVRAEADSGRALARMSADIARMVAHPGAIAGRARLTRAGPYSGGGRSWLQGPGGGFVGSTPGTQG
jgi:hypothetical protein